MSFAEVLKAWKAESIEYKRGSYSMWGNFRKVRFTTDEEIAKLDNEFRELSINYERI